MSKSLAISLMVVLLVIGLAGGAFAGYKYYPIKNKTTDVAETPITTSTDTDEELTTCLKAKWGETKYQAITANSSLASVDDKFNALPCYK